MKILPVTSNQKQQGFGIKGVMFKFDEKILENVFPSVERQRVGDISHIKSRKCGDFFVDVDCILGPEKNKVSLIFKAILDGLGNPSTVGKIPTEEVILHSAFGRLNARSYRETLTRLASKVSVSTHS